MWQQDSNTIEQTAKGYADSGSRFAKAFLAEVQSVGNSGVELDEQWRPETCAAIWAAISATFDASHYSTEEQAELLPKVRQLMAPFWIKNCGPAEDAIPKLTARAIHYLPNDESDDIEQTAAHIVGVLFDSVSAANASGSSARRQLRSTLSSRMTADLRRLDAVNGRHSSIGLTNAPSRIRLSQANALRSLPRP